jgi:hypothetical protein
MSALNALHLARKTKVEVQLFGLARSQLDIGSRVKLTLYGEAVDVCCRHHMQQPC